MITVQVLAPPLEPAGSHEIGSGLYLGLQDIASRQEVNAVVELHQVHAGIGRRRTRRGIAPEEHQSAVGTLGRRGLACIPKAASSQTQGADGPIRLDTRALLAEGRQRGLDTSMTYSGREK